MNKLLSEFPIPDFASWEAKFLEDLKGQSTDLIHRDDAIEDISFACYQHPSSIEVHHEVPGAGTYERGTLRDNNAWVNCVTIPVEDDRSANQKALQFLNMGATGIRFDIGTRIPDLSVLLNEIGLEYIHTSFIIQSAQQFSAISKYTETLAPEVIAFELDGVDFLKASAEFSTIAMLLKARQQRCFLANGSALQRCGANATQEIAYCLISAHEYLVQLIDSGLTVDEATACIHFNVSTGGHYFYDIAKLRVVKQLWATVVAHYSPEHKASLNAHITGLTGFVNKSLADPHTNLLRLTTEAMALISGGVERLSVLPYDYYSSTGVTDLSARMALNIPSILQEESYFDKVIDPLGGSYTVTHLTNLFAQQSWDLFQQWDTQGGLLNDDARAAIRNAVEKKAQLRIQRVAEKKDVFIGINLFPNPKAEQANWKPIPDYLGLPALILEDTVTA